LTNGVTSDWQVVVFERHEDKDVFQERFEVEPSSGVLTEESLCAVCKIRLPDDNWQPQTVALIEAVIYFCEPSGTCRMEELVYEVPLLKTDGEGESSLQINHNCKL